MTGYKRINVDIYIDRRDEKLIESWLDEQGDGEYGPVMMLITREALREIPEGYREVWRLMGGEEWVGGGDFDGHGVA